MPPELRTLLTGLAFGESPRWHDGRLWFSNWVAQEIVAVDPDGGSEVMVRMPFSQFPFSIDWLPDGRLLIASASDRPLLCQEPDGSLVTYAESDRGWNELVVDGRGNAYVNGAGFDPMAGAAFAPGIVALVTPDGSVRQVADGIAFPNGMAITADNATLIVADSYGHELTAFDIEANGDLSNRRAWADLGDGVPDGISMDTDGAIWYADVPNKRCVRVREGGEVLQSIDLDHGCFACMLGGAEGTTLFMLTAEWLGFDRMTDAKFTGRVVTTSAPARSAGYPAST
ncbi:MAG TPA: SMP-30/gluconolactonase/LRE family protein [Candidatus Limnocylindrales bacterium]|nr:SMP-30/gluconolactonase/LRE family protein [Candidatus Limnocylindrales bacterium]